MGQYHAIVNLNRKEYLDPHACGVGFKAGEQLGSEPSSIHALFVLLLGSNGRGGGDLRTPEPEGEKVYGRWAGDRIAVVGDYAEHDDFPTSEGDPSPVDIWKLRDEPDGFRDISYLVMPIVRAELAD
jgi:hypothetical protein